MTTTTNFLIGNKFKHYNGYVWAITSIIGKIICLESTNQTDGQTVKGNMTTKDLNSVIKLGYYKQL